MLYYPLVILTPPPKKNAPPGHFDPPPQKKKKYLLLLIKRGIFPSGLNILVCDKGYGKSSKHYMEENRMICRTVTISVT